MGVIGGQRLSPRSSRASATVVSWLIGLPVAVLLPRAMINGGISVSGGLIGLLVVVLWLGFWWRAARTGVFVSRSHVCVRGLLTSRTVPLSSVSRADAMAHNGMRHLAEFDQVLADLRMRVKGAPRTRPKERKRRQPRPSEAKPEPPEDLPPGMIERREW